MVKNEFLPFGLADGANVLSNDEYSKLAARTNGFSSGVAKSEELNTVWRQASVIASVVAQFIAETTGTDVLDDGNLATLQNGLLNALRTTVSSTVPDASLTTAGITKLSDAIDSNAENVAATSRAVKTAMDTRLEKSRNGADIPNKSEFVKNLGLRDGAKMPAAEALHSSAGYISIPTLIGGNQVTVFLQWKNISVPKSADGSLVTVTTTWPVPFPTACISIIQALNHSMKYATNGTPFSSAAIIDRSYFAAGSAYSHSQSVVTVWGVGY